MLDNTQKFINDLNSRITVLEDRLTNIETSEGAALYAVDATYFTINNVTILAGNTQLSTDVRGVDGVPSNAKGVFVQVSAATNTAAGFLGIAPSDETPDQYNAMRAGASAAGVYDFVSSLMMTNLGPDGKFVLGAIVASWAVVYASVVGWWR